MAEFKTAHLQRMVPLDVAVIGTIAVGTAVTSANRAAAICCGDLVTLTAAGVDSSSRAVPAYITKAASLAAATHMIALTDMTINNVHVPTDLRDYRSSELVGVTRAAVAEATPILYTDVVKKVGLYPLFDKDDIVLDADGHDLAAA